MLTPTDGWTTCAQGHRHWGLAGAAGLFLHRHGASGFEVLLQHRADWSHHGGTWGTPGGALHHGETADAGALREVQEELGLRPDDVILGAHSVDNPARSSPRTCGWTARATGRRGCRSTVCTPCRCTPVWPRRWTGCGR